MIKPHQYLIDECDSDVQDYIEELEKDNKLLKEQGHRCYKLWKGFVNWEYLNVLKEMKYLGEITKEEKSDEKT